MKIITKIFKAMARWGAELRSQGKLRLAIWLSGWLITIAILSGLRWFLHHHNLSNSHFIWLSSAGAVFGLFMLFVWPRICQIKFRPKVNGRRVNSLFFIGVCLLSVWLSTYVAIAADSAALSTTASSQTAAAQNQQQQPTIVVDCLFVIFVILVAGALCYCVFGFVYDVVCHLFWGIDCDLAPTTPTNNVEMALSPHSSLANPQVALPSFSLTVSNGMIVSNTAGLKMSSGLNFIGGLPNFGALTNTESILPSQPPITFWQEITNTYDPILDPTHPYLFVANYSLLTSTNLSDWTEVYTVKAWCNNDVTTPLLCAITFTNGVGAATNWYQAFLSGMQCTNIVVYGQLYTNAPVYPTQFFKMTAPTNQVQTQWPYQPT